MVFQNPQRNSDSLRQTGAEGVHCPWTCPTGTATASPPGGDERRLQSISREGRPMASQHRKRRSTSPVTREMHINTTKAQHLTPTRTTTIKNKLQKMTVWARMWRHWSPGVSSEGMQIVFCTLKTVAPVWSLLKKLNIETPWGSAIPLLGTIADEELDAGLKQMPAHRVTHGNCNVERPPPDAHPPANRA